MAREISKTQIDRLGDRLKKGDITEADLRLLDQYRRSFTGAYEVVVGAIRKELGLEPTGRPAKSTTSISDKLRRESIRLTQIQDIAGCRLIVSDIAEQERVVQSLHDLFEDTSIIDRREKPSHGYRAVHVVVKHQEKLIEVQIRTSLQHLWAELSEKLSDVYGPAIKYGGGDKDIQEELAEYSAMVAKDESLEVRLREALAQLCVEGDPTDERNREMSELQKRLLSLRQELHQQFRDFIKLLEEL